MIYRVRIIHYMENIGCASEEVFKECFFKSRASAENRIEKFVDMLKSLSIFDTNFKYSKEDFEFQNPGASNVYIDSYIIDRKCPDDRVRLVSRKPHTTSKCDVDIYYLLIEPEKIVLED